MKYVIYARVSTEEQSLESQVDDCRTYCEVRKKPYTVKRDFGVSGSLPLEKRDVLLEAIEALEKGDVLLALKPDRLARSKEIGAVKYLVRQRKATIEYVDGTVTDSLDSGEMLLEGVKNLFAEYELMQIRIRTHRAMKKKKDSLERVGTIPYGYTLDESILMEKKDLRSTGKPYRLVPNIKEGETLLKMHKLKASGKSYAQIAEYMAVKGYRNRRGNPFARDGIHKILSKIDIDKYRDQLRAAKESELCLV